MQSFGQVGYTVIGVGGARYGPADAGTVAAWIAAGRVLATSPVEDPVTGATRPAGEMPEFADLFAGVRPGAPQRPPAGGTPPNFGGYGYAGLHQYGGYNGQAGYTNSAHMHAEPYGPMPKQKLVAILLAIFLGWAGAHRLYLGRTGSGIAMLLMTFPFGLLTCGLTSAIAWVWAIVDTIRIATGDLRDSDGRELI